MSQFGHTRAQVLAVPTPPATATYTPVAYATIIQLVIERLAFRQVRIKSEEWAIKADGDELYGMLRLDLPGTMGEVQSDYMLGIQASHNKRKSVLVVGGEHVWICENGMWSGDIAYRRKHTGDANEDIRTELIKLVDAALGARHTQAERWNTLRNINLNPSMEIRVELPGIPEAISPQEVVMPGKSAARLVLLVARNRGIITGKQEVQIGREFNRPRYQEFRSLNGFNLVQAVTTCARHNPGWSAEQSMRAPIGVSDLMLAMLKGDAR